VAQLPQTPKTTKVAKKQAGGGETKAKIASKPNKKSTMSLPGTKSWLKPTMKKNKT